VSELCRRLEWDSEFWGIPIAQVDGNTLTAETVHQVNGWCSKNEIACLYFLARSDQPATTRIAEENGFRSVDIRVTLTRELDGQSTGGAVSGIRKAQPGDREALARYAREGYRYTRFYNDEHFPDERCDDLYETWILGNLDGLADQVLVLEQAGEVFGYISCHLADRKVGSIGLSGVEQTERGAALGGGLLAGAHAWFERHGAGPLSVGTQGRNWVTQRMLQRAGYVTEKTEIWYHRWYRPEVLGEN